MEQQEKENPEHIKLKKSSNGYLWEIKIFLKEENQDKEIIKRIQAIDIQLKKD